MTILRRACQDVLGVSVLVTISLGGAFPEDRPTRPSHHIRSRVHATDRTQNMMLTSVTAEGALLGPPQWRVCPPFHTIPCPPEGSHMCSPHLQELQSACLPHSLLRRQRAACVCIPRKEVGTQVQRGGSGGCVQGGTAVQASGHQCGLKLALPTAETDPELLGLHLPECLRRDL